MRAGPPPKLVYFTQVKGCVCTHTHTQTHMNLEPVPPVLEISLFVVCPGSSFNFLGSPAVKCGQTRSVVRLGSGADILL